ncbi:MAG: T9SS type A sorting domain-containing protein [Bacteroidia bacterium]|nr:T9SS type A sorting domain-containing protein [Bacteroidia bacterium]NNJ54586.1 T9SS type A sorting domain-containing protein [Bacteroidia bacterium]
MNRFIIIILLIGLPYWVNAQSLERQVVSTAGIAVQNSSAMISYTVGESATLSSVTQSVILSQGFQQADSTEFVGIPKLESFAPNLFVYPNPTRDNLNIQINGLKQRGITHLNMQIMDLHGKLIKEISLDSKHEQIDVSELRASTYLIRLYSLDGSILQRVRFVKY